MAKIIDAKDNLKDLLELKNATEESVDLFFYGDIVSSWWGAWDNTDQYPESIKNFLQDANGRALNIHINSGGGSVFAGIAIYNMIKNYPGSKTVYVDGMAASIASVIALSGDKLVMRTGSTYMVHKPAYNIWGGYNASELRKLAEDLDQVQKCIMQVYEENLRNQADKEEFTRLLEAETYMTGPEVEQFFDVEVEALQAVACISEYIAKYTDKPPQYAKGKPEDKADIEKEKAIAKLRLIELGGKK